MTRTLTTIFSLLGLSLAFLLGAPAPFTQQAIAQFDADPFADQEPAEDIPPVTLHAAASRSAVRPGEQFVIAVVFDHADGWHIHPHIPIIPPELGDFAAIATEAVPEAVEGATFGPIQWPHAEEVEVRFTGDPVPYSVYHDEAIAYIPIILDPDLASDELTFTIAVTYQSCNETVCDFPQNETLTITLPVLDADATANASPANPALFADFDLSVFSRSETWSDEYADALNQQGGDDAISFNVFGWSFDIDAAGVAGFALLLLLAILGGALLNVTPCVLPVIPIKIMGLSHSAGNPGRTFLLGAIMSLGIITFWLALGGAIATIAGFTAISTLFQMPWFVFVVGAVIAIMAVGMLGLFTFRLPNAVYAINPSHDTLHGSFLFGIMTAVLSTPCTAPFMGAASGWAATQPPAITLLTFAAIGLGMALPYIILSANPKWVSKVPRTGPASELVKQTMGLLMLAVAAFFIGTGFASVTATPLDPPTKLHWWLVGALVAGAMGWMIYRTFQITKKPARRVFFTGMGVVISVGALFLASLFAAPSKIEWVYYTPELFAQARAQDRVVMIDFTAEWCLNCKALEHGVLERKEVLAAINSPGVVPMKIDLTGDNPVGKAKLKELNWVGIPLLTFYGPGFQGPLKYGDGYTPEMVIRAIDDARGGSIPTTAALIP